MYRMTDHFCGGGGSSAGGKMVPGVEITAAANHWPLALETHNTNHPEAQHIQADLNVIHPGFFPYTELAWFSPSCPGHSQARGVQDDREADSLWGETLPTEAAARSRATMWDVVRFTEHHRYLAVIVENVIEVAKWGPNRNGQIFANWLTSMVRLGYKYRIMCINSMHASAEGMPAPQSRDRIYIVFWQEGNPTPDLDSVIRPAAKCGTCDMLVAAKQSWKKPGNVVGRYRQQYVYRCPQCSAVVEPYWVPAASIIDWTNLGVRIGDRERPLADKTRARIAAGIARYWGPLLTEAAGATYDAADPKHVRHGDPNAYYRAWPVDEPVKTIHTTMSKALAVPVEGRDGKSARPTEEALRTQTARNETGLAFIAHLKGSEEKQIAGAHSPVSDPLHTVAASGNHHGLVTPYYGTAKGATTTEEPLGTVTATDRWALVMRNVNHRGNGSAMSTPVDEPMRTVTASVGHSLLMRNNEGGPEMTTPVSEPIRTVTTKGHQSLLTPADIELAAKHVDDVLFRMLEPDECKRAMAFGRDYVLLGNKREQVRMAGNAVTPPVARDLIAAVVRSLEGLT